MMRKKLLISGFSFRSIHNLTSISSQLSFEGCNSVGSSTVQWRRGLSYAAASVSSEIPNTQKSRKRLSKHERRALVETFVNKYRSENGGKFPNLKYTQQQVGGGYYFVREIVQELQHKSKMKSSNSTDGILVEKLFDETKLKTAEPVSVSAGNIETAKNKPIQDEPQLAPLDDKETINTGCKHLEENRGPQTSSWEGTLSNEVEVIPTQDDHCIISESNILEKHLKEPCPLSLQMPDDVKTEEAVSSSSHSVPPDSQLLQEETECISTPFSENYGAVYGKTRSPESEFVDMENHQKMEEKCVEKAGYERSERPALKDMSGMASHSNPQVPNDVKGVEAVASCSSDYVAPERHLLKEEIEKVSAPFIDNSGSNCSKDQIHDSKFGDIENHQIDEIKSFKKEGFAGKVQDGLQDLPGVDSQKHKKEQSQGSLEMDVSKIDSSNKGETSGAVDSEKPTLWGNLRSFADGILNIWRKF